MQVLRQNWVRYFIVNDTVMTLGSGYGQDDYAAFRTEVQEFLKHQGSLVVRIPSDYYGELEIYHVKYE